MGNLSCCSITNRNGCVIIDTNVHTDNIVTRKLDNGVICHHRENKYRLVVLNFHHRQGDLTFSETGVVEAENESIPSAANNQLEGNLTINKGVIFNHGVLFIDSTKVDEVTLAIRRWGSICGTLPSLTHILRRGALYGFGAFLPGAILGDYAVLN